MSFKEGKTLGLKLGIPFIEIDSWKEGSMEDPFKLLAKMILENYDDDKKLLAHKSL